MIDSSTKKRVVAIQRNNQIRIKLYSWSDISYLEDYLFEKLGIEIDLFKSVKDQSGKEIGSELIFEKFKDINLLQDTINNFEIDIDP